MGWTTTSDYERFSKGLFTIKEYLDREFASDHPDFPRYEVLDSSLHGRSEYYAAMRSTDRKTGKSETFALIALVSYKPSDPDGHTLGWKEMSENSGPFCFNCPSAFSPCSTTPTMKTPSNGGTNAASTGRGDERPGGRSRTVP